MLPKKDSASLIQRHEQLQEGLCRLFMDCIQNERPVRLKEYMDGVEKALIIRILYAVNGNQRAAARVLGVKPTTLCEKIKKHRILLNRKHLILFPPRPFLDQAEERNPRAAFSSAPLE